MPVPTDGRIVWVGTNGTIPTNWTRDTDFDDRYIQVDDNTFTASANGGSATHTHDLPLHFHDSNNSHTHQFSAQSATAATTSVGGGSSNFTTAATHTHAAATSTPTTITFAGQLDGAVTSSATANEPAYIRVIVIKPDDALQEIPDDSVCFTDEATLGSFTLNTDFNDRFARGMTTGGDAGGTGSSGSHTHTTTAHKHNAMRHAHTAATCGAATAVSVAVNTPTATTTIGQHHSYALGQNRSTQTDNASPNLAATEPEPAYTRLMAMSNETGVASTPEGAIIMYVGDPANLTSDWELVRHMRVQIKFTDTSSEIGDTGGANEHDHTINHAHTLTGSHTHSKFSSTETDLGGTYIVNTGSSSGAQTSNHNHVWDIGSATDLWTTNENVDSTSTDGRYLYRTIRLIRKILITVSILGETNILGKTEIL